MSTTLAATTESALNTLPRRPMIVVPTVLLLLTLAGCSGLKTRELESIRLFQANAGLSHWQLRGRIGIKTADSADSAYLNWRQCGDRFDIRLNGPLGTGAARLVGNSQGATLHQSNRDPISASSAEELLTQHLGWHLPVSQLGYWVRGIPSPDTPARGQQNGFSQSGWSLQYPRQTRVADYHFPGKAIARHRDITVTILFQQWQLQPECGEPL